MKAQLPFLYDMRMFAKDQTREVPEEGNGLAAQASDHLDTLEQLRDQLLQIEQILARGRQSKA